jgi:hypothetical protein
MKDLVLWLVILGAVAVGLYFFVIRPRREKQLAGQAATAQAIQTQGIRAVLGPSLMALRGPPLAVAA